MKDKMHLRGRKQRAN